MLARLPEYDGQSCDLTAAPMSKAVGAFARGATGRVCLVLVYEFAEEMQLSTLTEINEWAESVPGGYLDF